MALASSAIFLKKHVVGAFFVKERIEKEGMWGQEIYN
jgi:hypothetical protein